MIHGLTENLLRGHVSDRSQDDSLARPVQGRRGRVRRPRRWCIHRHRRWGRVRFGELGEPEVEDLRVAVLRDHEIAGLEVAVDDPGGVGLGESLGRLRQPSEECPEIGSTSA